MRHPCFPVAVVFALATAFVSPQSRAQWGYGNDYGNSYGDTLRCESRNGRTQRCDTGGGDAELIRQLSDTACVRGRTWGSDRGSVWVSGGCRAEFRVYRDAYGGGYGSGYGGGYGDDRIVRCESRNGRTQRCDTGGGYAELVRQLSDSPCDRGRTWGSDRNGVWVSGGCRADFRIDRYDGGYGGGYGGQYGGSDIIRCESRDNRSTTCSVPYGQRGSVRLIRQMSSQPCVEGDTWGRTSGGIWVTRGCRGEFVVDRSNRRGVGPTWPPGDPRGGSDGWGNRQGNGQIIRCESNDQRTVRCGVPIYRRAELARQLSQSPCQEGGSWGWDQNGIWVSRGCRGEFRVW